MTLMSEERLPKDIREAICDRLQGWELVDFLGITIEDIVEMFEEEIEEKLSDVLEFIGLYGLEDDESEAE